MKALFRAQCAAKRGALELRGALAAAISPEDFVPEVAGAVKAAWAAAREAEAAVYQAIQQSARPAKVVDLASARARRGRQR